MPSLSLLGRVLLHVELYVGKQLLLFGLRFVSITAMTLPRRLPWRTQESFEEVFNLLFRADGDSTSQTLGIQHIHVWISRSCCPQAAEATATLLSVVQRDIPNLQASTSIFHADLRLAYAMALTRFVNGMVDPAQQGAYARSIASIAQQLGLPLWFVDLRHASTHEDLPSLPILRNAARNALDWLYQNYWLPQIQCGESSEDISALSDKDRQRLSLLILEYKALQKQILRDLSQSDYSRSEIVLRKLDSALSDIDHKLAHSPYHRGSTTAVQYLAEILTDPGYLVPLSKKKRCSPLSSNKAYQPTLPDSLKKLWALLIEDLCLNHSNFIEHLIWALFETQTDISASGTSDDQDSVRNDKSYIATIVAWLLHLIPQSDYEVRRNLLRQCMLHPNVSTDCIADSLLKQDSHMQTFVLDVRQVRRAEPALIAPIDVSLIEGALQCMQHRLDEQLRSPVRHQQVSDDMDTNDVVDAKHAGHWSTVDKHAWLPCPMGTLPGGSLPSLAMVVT